MLIVQVFLRLLTFIDTIYYQPGYTFDLSPMVRFHVFVILTNIVPFWWVSGLSIRHEITTFTVLLTTFLANTVQTK